MSQQNTNLIHSQTNSNSLRSQNKVYLHRLKKNIKESYQNFINVQKSSFTINCQKSRIKNQYSLQINNSPYSKINRTSFDKIYHLPDHDYLPLIKHQMDRSIKIKPNSNSCQKQFQTPLQTKSIKLKQLKYSTRLIKSIGLSLDVRKKKKNKRQKEKKKNMHQTFLSPYQYKDKKVRINKGTITKFVKMQNKINQKGYIFQDYLLGLSINNYIKYQTKKASVAYIHKGNNSQLIRLIIRKRYWWIIKDSISQDCNFVWSQKRKQFFTPAQIIVQKNSQIFRIQKNSKKNAKVNKLLGLNSSLTELQPQPYFQFQKSPETVKKQIKLNNHLPNSKALSSKKCLFLFMKSYMQKWEGRQIPLTFLLKPQSPQFTNFKRFNQSKNLIWILKPAQGTNRGKGIIITQSIKQIQQIIIKNKYQYLIQNYIKNPYLYNKRKFDIRGFMLLTVVNASLKAYFYDDGYIRTCSEQFTLDNLSNQIHLTNDAIQKQTQLYGKYQSANKLSYQQMKKYMNQKGDSFDLVTKRMEKLTIDAISTAYTNLKYNQQGCFQIFGLDFMVDQKLNTYLIQINSNPMLQICGSLTSVIIPQMLDNAFRICLDPIFPPDKMRWGWKGFDEMDRAWQLNKFKLIFDQVRFQANS